MLKLKLKYKRSLKQLRSKTDQATERVAKRFGAYVRTTARRSLKRPTKDGSASKPGEPPRSQTGTLKRSILFAYDPNSRSVLIGARQLPGKVGKDSPEALEKGGSSTALVRVNGRVVRRRQKVAKRPFMLPALEQRIDELAPMWRDAIK